MMAQAYEPHGADLLTQELKEEAGRLVHHPILELRRLEHVAAEGDSPTTPMLVILGVAGALALIAAVAMAIALFAYYTG
jgi:hypothetical protein